MTPTFDRHKAYQQALAYEKAMREKGEIDVLEDVARSGLSGFGEGVAGTIGLGGDLPGMVLRGGDWVGRKAGMIDDTPEHRAWMDDTVKSVDDWNPLPTSEETLGVMNDASRGLGPNGEGLFEHDPRTGLGQVVHTMGELAPAALTGGGGLARKGAMWLGSSLGSEAAGRLAEGTGYEDWARAAGAILGSGRPRFKRAQPARSEGEWKSLLDDADARVVAVGERNPAKFADALRARKEVEARYNQNRILNESHPSGTATRESFANLAQDQSKMAQFTPSMQNAIRRAAGDSKAEKIVRRIESKSLPPLPFDEAHNELLTKARKGAVLGAGLGGALGDFAETGLLAGAAFGAVPTFLRGVGVASRPLAEAISNRNVRNAEREIRTGLRPGANRDQALKLVTRALLQNQGIQAGR